MSKLEHKKLLVIQVAGLGYNFLNSNCRDKDIPGISFEPIQGVFPALTCSVQASIRTATTPSCHGMVSNGVFSEELCKPIFWGQSARLVSGSRIWEQFRREGGSVGLMFFQQSLGEDADLILSPAPIHKHSGGMIQDCYCKPEGLYKFLCEETGQRFNLMRYWGPLASAKVGDWIAEATSAVINSPEFAPNVCFTYLPSLDYDLQRYGPEHHKTKKALEKTIGQLKCMLAACQKQGYESVIFGDYCITQTPGGAIFPNRVLLDAGMMNTRKVNNMLYPDFYTSRAFAMVDHQIAHVFIKQQDDIEKVRQILSDLEGIDKIFDRREQSDLSIDHANSGQLVLVADKDHWFAYPWWRDPGQKPDYAGHVDIHNKPGYDPCELFFGFPPPSVTQNTSRIKGSHGRVDSEKKVALGTSLDFSDKPSSLIELALALKKWFNEV